MSTDRIQTESDSVRPIDWQGDSLRLLDQRLLPTRVEYLQLETVEQVADAIRNMTVRGAPAIGIAAAYGFVMALQDAIQHYPGHWHEPLQRDIALLRDARPTAVNLGWALDRMSARLEQCADDPLSILDAEARAIHNEDIVANRAMGASGASYIKPGQGLLTHCNTGSLATGGYGTALGVIRSVWEQGRCGAIYLSETRPWLQGSRLTAWELGQDNIPATLVADSAAAYLMQRGEVQWIITGADRIAANGDVANKIGTYSHAVNARFHNIGFMVVAPISTIDLQTGKGEDIEIEERGIHELHEFAGKRIAPETVSAWNPVFDITPAALVSVLITERGAIENPDEDKIRRLLGPKTP